MNAIVQDTYGAPGDVLGLKEVAEPQIKNGEVLVRVRAAGVSISDWHLIRGVPYVLRMGTGLRGPRRKVPGVDLAGEVQAVGDDVKTLGPGDEVFGWGVGAFAELASAAEGNLLPKPTGLSFEQAAAVGDSAITALTAVRDQGKVAEGQVVLVHGASGGVGTYAVQIAKWLGAKVTGVCSARNAEMVRSLGADEVIDYTREDFTQGEQRCDVIIDTVGNRSLSEYRKVLTRRGTYVLVGTRDVGRWFGMSPMIRTLASSPFVSQRMRAFIATRNQDDLATLKELVEGGEVRPVIDRRFELGDVPEALRHQGEGHARGKIVIST